MSCLFKQCLHSGPNGYFSSICWLGTKSAGLPSQLHQEWQCFPCKHGRRLTQRGRSLCKHVQTCKHRPSSSVYVALVSQGGENLKFLPCQFAVADISQEKGWDVGGVGWVGEERRMGLLSWPAGAAARDTADWSEVTPEKDCLQVM